LETEVLGGNLPQYRCVHQRSHMIWPRVGDPGHGSGKPETSSPILVTLMMEALCSSETSVLKTYSVTSQKMVFFIVTVVKTSNLT
jgi:hypothetical protein